MSKKKKLLNLFLALFFLYLFGVTEYLDYNRNKNFVSPYKNMERAARYFSNGLGSGHVRDINFRAYHKYFTELFKIKGYHIYGKNGFFYKNAYYGEEFIFYLNYVSKEKFFYPRDELFELLFFTNMELEDKIVDYWLEPFYLDKDNFIMGVSYRYKSGAIVQIGDIYEIEGKPKKSKKEHDYKVLRMYFYGDKYKYLFPKAYFTSDEEINSLKTKWGLNLEKYRQPKR